MKRPRKTTARVLTPLAAFLAALPIAVGAEEAKDAVLPTVTVNARLSSESAKDVPFSLSVIGGEQLEERRLLNLEEALRSVPGVDVNSSGDSNYAIVRIRGVGSLNRIGEDDASVTLNIDGVAMPIRNVSLGTLDVERVEVLKGPQGTLFGRNSEAGAINVVTRRPTREREGYVRAEAGEEGQYLAEAAVSGPLSERVSGRIAVRGTRADHWITNTQNGAPLTKPSEEAFRASLLWNPSAGTSALATAEHQKIERDVSLMILRPFGDKPANDFTPGTFDRNEKTMDRYSVQIDHNLSDSRITSITALVSTERFGVVGYDRAIMRALYGFPMEYTRQESSDERVLSQELRWSSRAGSSVFWVTGLNLSRSERAFDSRIHSTGDFQNRNYTTDSDAIFGEMTYPLSERLKLTAGLRHSWDRKTYDADYHSGATVVEDDRRLRDDYSTGRVALTYALTPLTNLYGMAARGYKSGGISDYTTQIADSVPYKPAVANTAEIGFKTESPGRQLAVNGALFFSRVRDDHLLGFDNTTFATSAVNADTRSKGVEIDGTWRPGNGFSVSAGLAYVDAQIASDAPGVSGGDVTSGSRVPDVPHWSGNLSVSHRKALPEFLGLASPVMTTSLSYRFVGSRAADAQNHFNLGAYRKLDLRVGLASGSTEVYAWADNLLNERYDLYGYYFAPTATIGAPHRGRTLGVGAALYF